MLKSSVVKEDTLLGKFNTLQSLNLLGSKLNNLGPKVSSLLIFKSCIFLFPCLVSILYKQLLFIILNISVHVIVILFYFAYYLSVYEYVYVNRIYSKPHKCCKYT